MAGGEGLVAEVGGEECEAGEGHGEEGESHC